MFPYVSRICNKNMYSSLFRIPFKTFGDMGERVWCLFGQTGFVAVFDAAVYVTVSLYNSFNSECLITVKCVFHFIANVQTYVLCVCLYVLLTIVI